MIKAKSLSDPDYKSESLQLDFLLAEGIKLIQQFSGEVWTDYNYHDPGITFLEQLCYAVTDLGYRNHFPLEDLLFTKERTVDLEKSNMLYPPNKILPSNPLTANDYRRLIIDQVEEIKNAWISPVVDNKFGFQGLYDISIQCKEDIVDEDVQIIENEVKTLLMENRSLGTDFQSIKILKKDTVSIAAKINLDSFVLGESILASIYHRIEQMINPDIRFYDEEEMLKKGYDHNALYTGPAVQSGYLDLNKMQTKTNEIYVNEIKEVIENIEGVISVDSIEVYKNGVKIFDDLISFGKSHYPALEKNILNYAFASEKIIFYRNRNRYEIDSIILSQLYDSLALENQFKTANLRSKKALDYEGRFKKADLEEYYSIQQELPSLYGLKTNELSSSSNKKRKAQAKQLKGYLAIFEQLMADHLSQLANINNIFSIDKSIHHTYFKQYPEDIPDFATVIKQDSKENYLSTVHQLTESRATYFARRNQIIDHLLSRFGEHFDTSILMKLQQSLFENADADFCKETALHTKIDYAANIIELGHNRIKGFNYEAQSWEADNSSGFEKRLKFLLGIKEQQIKSLVAPLLDSYQSSNDKDRWETMELKVEEGPVITVEGLSRPYEQDELNFHCQNKAAFRSLFLFAHRSKNYRIVPSKEKKGTVYNLLYNTPNQNHPTKIFEAESRAECIEKRDVTIARFQELNISCEGFFQVEHILLRPLISTNYSTTFYYEDGKESLISHRSGEFEDQRDRRDDVYIIASNPDNYSVEEIKDKKYFNIIIFDVLGQPVFKSANPLYSKAGVKSEIKKLVAFFSEKRSLKANLDDFSAIKIDDGHSHEFPTDFKYSNHISLVFPDWPFRVQNSEFTALVKDYIDTFIPAHITYDMYFLEVNRMAIFEDTFFNWLNAKKNQDNDLSDTFSLQLIQLLKGYKPFV